LRGLNNLGKFGENTGNLQVISEKFERFEKTAKKQSNQRRRAFAGNVEQLLGGGSGW
jgi:hypothetical protein